MYISTFFILVIEVLEFVGTVDVLSRSRADRHSPRHFLARGRVIERVAFARPSLRTSSSRCATWTSCACCGTTATARPARDRPRKRQTSPPRRWTPQRAPGKTRALQRRRETRTFRCAMSRVSTGVARAFEFARHDPVNDPRVTAPPRPPRPSLATVRLPPIKREIFFLILTRHFVRHPAGRSLRGRQRRVRPSAPASQRDHYERRRRRVVPGSARVFQSRDDVASMRAIRRRARRRDKRATRLRDFSVFKKRFWRFAFRAAFGEDHVRSSGRAREPRTRVGSLRRFAGRAEAPRRLALDRSSPSRFRGNTDYHRKIKMFASFSGLLESWLCSREKNELVHSSARRLP